MDKTTNGQDRAVTTGAAAAQRRNTRPPRLGALTAPNPGSHDPVSSDPEAAHEWLSTYRPADLDPKSWTAVRPFVVECAGRLIDDHQVSEEALRRRYVRALTKLACYCRSTHQGLRLTTVLDSYTVNQFAAAVATVDPSSAGTYQSALRYVGERLCPSPLWERVTPVNRRAVQVPYSPAELEVLRTQIARNTTERRRGGEGLMVLGLGAGLDGRWAARVGREDAIDDGDGLVIAVDGRLVPVLREFEPDLRELLRDTPAGGLIVGGTATHKNAANEIANRLRLDTSCPPLNCGRLRSTWIVSHLTLGNRLPELAEAAGTVGITTFSDLLEFVPHLPGSTPRSQQAAREMLRGHR